MKRIGQTLLAVILVGTAASTSHAWWFQSRAAGCADGCCGDQCGHGSLAGDPIDSCVDGYHENKQWPGQYLCADRVHAHAPFHAMVANGWRRQNLLGSHHFNEDSTQLTQAGQLKVRWIMTQAPPQYRRVFVEQGLQAETTDARIAAANAYATGATTAGPAPQVVATHIQSEGRPAATVDYVNNQFRENMIAPVLPASTGSGTGQ